MENPFAVPPPLFSRKRRASVAALESENVSVPFIREETYHAYAVDGHVREAAVYYDEYAKREAILERMSSRKRPTTPAPKLLEGTSVASVVTSIQPMAAVLHASKAAPVVGPKPGTHLAMVLLERAEKENSREMIQVVNVARRISALPIVDHIEYMRLRQKRIGALASGMPLVLALTAEEHQEWERLVAATRLEQTSFLGDLERIAKKEKLSQYTFVPPHIHRLYDAFIQTCRNQVMHLYPRYYEMQLAVRLHGSIVSGADRSASTMKHIQEVMSQGPRNVLDLEKLNATLSIDSNLVEQIECADNLHATATWSAISADPTAEKLMELHDCDVAMTSSTLTAIFDTAVDADTSESLGWIVPVKSRVCMVHGKPRRQIYLDRPLINTEVSAREKIRVAAHPIAVHSLVNKDYQGDRVSYHVWKMGDFKVLVRTKVQLYMDDPSTTSQVAKPVSVFIKPDHRPLGIEETLTDSEYRRMWLHSWIRGGSTLVLGRLSPQTSVVTSWSKYQYSDLAQLRGSPGFPETFESLDFFDAVNTVLTSLHSLPAASFLLKFDFREDKKRGRELHILRSATEFGLEDGHQHQFDLFQHINTSGQTSTSTLGYIVPTWLPVPDRIPYTYRTGSHCPEFLQHSMCDKEANGVKCEFVHLRLVFTKKAITWAFEDFTTAPAAKRSKSKVASMKARKLAPNFPFCRGTKDLQGARLISNSHMPIRCEDPTNCPLPHLSLHAIAERVADTELRAARERRRKHKTANRGRKGDYSYDNWN